MPNWALFLIRLTLGIAASVAMTWIGWKMGGKSWALIGLVFSTPVIGVAIAKPLVEMAHDGFTWLWQQPMAKWQGIYYEFGGVQVRVIEDDGALWFAAADVIRATGIKAKAATLLETKRIAEFGLDCLDIDGVERLLTRHRNHEAQRFIVWARREVVTPWERKKVGALAQR